MKYRIGTYLPFLLTLTVLLVVILFPSTVIGQCSMCKAVVGSNLESGDGVSGLGVNNAILYLMAMPYIIVLVLGYVFFGDKIKARFKRRS